MIGLFRTSPPTKENRRHGLTQFLVDMKTPGITVNPIYQMTGQHDFNEVVFEDAFMPDDHVLGEIDGAWKQATSELAYERSGPERFLETFYVLLELVRALGRRSPTCAAPKGSAGWWRSCIRCGACRSRSTACCRPARSRWSRARSSRTSAPSGSRSCPHACASSPPSSRRKRPTAPTFEEQLAFATMIAPKLTIQGGTTEILRGIIARGLGLR